MSGEKREKPRQRTYLGGQVVLDDGVTVSCLIRNLSATGAMIELPTPATLPDSWILIDMQNARAYCVAVSWRRDMRMGLRLERAFDLTGDVPDYLRHIQRLWSSQRQIRGDGNLRS